MQFAHSNKGHLQGANRCENDVSLCSIKHWGLTFPLTYQNYILLQAVLIFTREWRDVVTSVL